MHAWLTLAAVNGLLAVAAGAFGAHALKEHLPPERLAIFETAARYHMYHALGVLAAAALLPRLHRGLTRAACGAFLTGIVLFSGSLYALALTGQTRLGMITPLGGAAFLAGWGLLAAAGLRRHDPT